MFSKRRVGPWFLFALLLLLGWISFRMLGVLSDAVLLGLFLAYITHPVYSKLAKKLGNKPISAGILLLVITVVILVPLVLIGLQLIDEVQSINEGLQDTSGFLLTATENLEQTFGMDAESSAAFVEDTFASVRNAISNMVRAAPAAAAEASIGLFVLYYVLYYAYIDGPALMLFLRDLLPMSEGHRDLLLHELQLVVRAVMYGTVLTALIQAIVGGIGFILFDVPNVLFWSFIMFVLALLPVVGPPIVWVPWVVYLFASGETYAAIGLLVWSALLVSGMDNIIRPKLIGSVAKIHPVVVLLGVLGGVAFFGFTGFILGPVVLSVFVTILQVYRKEFALRKDQNIDQPAWSNL